jgi:hypothetical protein
MTAIQSIKIYELLSERIGNDRKAIIITRKIENMFVSEDLENELAKQKRIGKLIKIFTFSFLSICYLTILLIKILK